MIAIHNNDDPKRWIIEVYKRVCSCSQSTTSESLAVTVNMKQQREQRKIKATSKLRKVYGGKHAQNKPKKRFNLITLIALYSAGDTFVEEQVRRRVPKQYGCSSTAALGTQINEMFKPTIPLSSSNNKQLLLIYFIRIKILQILLLCGCTKKLTQFP